MVPPQIGFPAVQRCSAYRYCGNRIHFHTDSHPCRFSLAFASDFYNGGNTGGQSADHINNYCDFISIDSCKSSSCPVVSDSLYPVAENGFFDYKNCQDGQYDYQQ